VSAVKIGFVGVGKMGSGMARNLLRAGHEVTVYNRTRDKAETLSGDGARIANSPADAARDAEAVFTILSDDLAVSEVVFGANGIAGALRKGAAHISSSTISVALSRRLDEEHKKRSQAFVVATVFGRPEAAEKKQLIVVTAGNRDVTERLRPLLDAIGRKTFVAGDEPWQANAIKVCGNFMIASMVEAFAEAFAVMRKAEIDPHAFLDVMAELFGSPVYKNYGQIIADERFEPAGFALRLGLKDVKLAIEAAEDFDAPMPFANVIRDHFISAMAHGQQELDWSSIARVLARNAGIPEPKSKTAQVSAGSD
jgi:3-hydroxyisobutyrate dehydrogenase-like beta-hydroxyacid dehydrogenase